MNCRDVCLRTEPVPAFLSATPRVGGGDGGWGVADYRSVGVRLVARALGCVAITLVAQSLRGDLQVTSWDGAGTITGKGWVVDATLLAELRRGTLLRPRLDATRAIAVAVRPPSEGLAGWQLTVDGGFTRDDLPSAARIVPVLAEPAMLREEPRPGEVPAGLLTARESQVLTLVGQGLTAWAIGRRCGISSRTVHKHLEHAYRKLGCHDRVSAVLLARVCGLLAG